MSGNNPDQIWLSGHCGKLHCERIWAESDDVFEDCSECGATAVEYLLATPERRAASEMRRALIRARRIIVCACGVNAPDSDPNQHSVVVEIDAALAKAMPKDKK